MTSGPPRGPAAATCSETPLVRMVAWSRELTTPLLLRIAGGANLDPKSSVSRAAPRKGTPCAARHLHEDRSFVLNGSSEWGDGRAKGGAPASRARVHRQGAFS